MVTFTAASITDVGLHRANNEDASLAQPEWGLFALADGMGGAAAGEIASRYFIDTVREVCAPPFPASEEMLCTMVQEAFRRANDRIISHAAAHPSDRGMGCTGELLVFHEGRYIIGHVGDSRVYLFRAGELRQVTKDHSLVQYQLDQGMLSPEQARNHPRRNIILRALGNNAAIPLDIIRGIARDDDEFMLCSDGLTDMVEDAEIRTILASADGLAEKTRQLIASALAAGGRDNITVVLCNVHIP